jgi:cobalt-precorrin 5A hydrolase
MKVRRKISSKADFAPSPPLGTSAKDAKAQRKDGDVTSSRAIGVWIVRQQGLDIGRYLATRLEAECYSPNENSAPSNREAFTSCFREHRQWVLVMTTGIAVRYLQGLLADKQSDPGVVVLDEGCRFAVSLSGGHEGGANQLAYRVANRVGAVPVITTATEALKPLVIGVGCRRGVSSEQIDSAIEHGLARIERSRSEVREIATIDLKQDEPGLNAWCERNGVALRVIPRELVQQRPWVTQPSDWVRKNIGVDGVCEACALLATFRGRLLLPKTILDGVTVAIVEESASCDTTEKSEPLNVRNE